MYMVLNHTFEDDAQASERLGGLWQDINQACLDLDVPLSHHHGIGRLRGPYLAEGRKDDLALLELIRNALDPDRNLNADLL
jgi:alkyldihydroxyacetonephosphate synthase